MLKHPLADKNGVLLNVQTGADGNRYLIVDTPRGLSAHWESADITTATTTEIIDVRPNESIMLTDIIVTLSKKVTNATIILRFSDGTNTENLFTFDASFASFQFSHAFQGGIRGWKDADFQIVTNQSTTVSVLIGYVHIKPAQTEAYDVWLAQTH